MKMGEGLEKKLSSVVTSPCDDPLGDELLQCHESNDDLSSECLMTSHFVNTECKNSEIFEKENESLGISGSLLGSKPMGNEEGSESLRDESETSSKFERSDGEDSMFGGNTDDEKNFNSYYRRREAQCSNEENDKNENKLVMNSAVAFGSDDWDDFMQENGGFTLPSMVHNDRQPEKTATIESEKGCMNSATTFIPEFSEVDIAAHKEEHLASNHGQAGRQLTNYPTTCSMDPSILLNDGQSEHIKDESTMVLKSNRVQDMNESAKFLEQSYIAKLLKLDRSSKIQLEEVPMQEDLKIKEDESEVKHQGAGTEGVIHIRDDIVSEEVELKQTSLLLYPLSNPSPLSHRDKEIYYSSPEPSKDVKLEISIGQSLSAPSTSVSNDATEAKRRIDISSSLSVDCSENQLTSIKSQKLELNELYDELVHDMEEILLESGGSPGFTLGNKIYQSYIPLPSRDGSYTASTSGTDDAHTVIQHPRRFDRVEVIGVRQKKGDVSLSERLVGVREYTVYRIRVWSGKDHWEVERRYREICALHRQLKKLFADQGRTLPPVWSSIEQESRNIFGSTTAYAIAERSVLIQECLNSVLQSRFPAGALHAIVCFLSPSKDLPNSPTYDANTPQFPFPLRSTIRGDVSSLGQTISLIVQKRPYKSNKQLLDEQHYSCAGCYKNFDDGKTRMQELVQTLGWGKPRLCEYIGQLYCSLCHTNDMVVLPARILHFWDFNQYPVSQMAKSYLDSIHDQPMLCVGAVNPFLFSKVPALQHVSDIRKRIGSMLPFVRCPFRRSIYKAVGSRRYLLESNDYFSIRDLVDLSKGVFAALPVMVETLSRKILEHIAEQCLICCDMGIPCNARQACDDPSSLIFPFQEGEIERCKSCQSVFHKHCFTRISVCPCSNQWKPGQECNTRNQSDSSTRDLSSNLPRKSADLSKGLFSGLFTKVSSLKSSESGEQQAEDKGTVIVMGSLPMTNL